MKITESNECDKIPSKIESIGDVKLENLGLRSIAALRGLKIKILSLGQNNLISINPISDSPSIENLAIENNGILFLDKLPINLKLFIARHNSFTNLSALKNIHDLSTLALEGMSVNSLDQISGDKIKMLQLIDMEISQCSNALSWPNLSAAMVQNTDCISHTLAKSSSTSLTQLLLWNFEEIKNIEWIGNFPNLNRLELDHFDIADISPILSLHHLNSLALSGNRNISDLEPISNHPTLRRFICKGCGISKIPPWNSQVLRDFWVANNSIEDLSPLVRARGLVSVSAHMNPIKNCPTENAPIGLKNFCEQWGSQ